MSAGRPRRVRRSCTLTLRDAPEAGRRVLLNLLTEPITVPPVLVDGKVRGWEYLGHGAPGRVLAGRLGVMPVTSVVPPGRSHDRYTRQIGGVIRAA